MEALKKASPEILMQPPEVSLTYEEDRITVAIRRITELQKKAKPGSSVEEFYQTIFEVLISLDESVMESRNMRRAYEKMCNRVEIMERALANALRREKREKEIEAIKNEDAKTGL